MSAVAHLEHAASGGVSASKFTSGMPPLHAVLVVNGRRWTSERPANSGEAESINADAAAILRALAEGGR